MIVTMERIVNMKVQQTNIQKIWKLFILDKNLTNSFGINIHTINILLCSASNYFANRFIKKII